MVPSLVKKRMPSCETATMWFGPTARKGAAGDTPLKASSKARKPGSSAGTGAAWKALAQMTTSPGSRWSLVMFIPPREPACRSAT
jgi:hypothetical protein